MKTMKKNAGFSLVELMVVIAIIGVLATIAIPKYNVFIAKSRTTEAQTNLAGIYSFNKNFMTEFNGYTSDLTGMGFKAEGKLRYNVGFTASTCPTNYATQTGAAAGTCFPPGSATYVDTVGQCGAATSSCSTLAGADGVVPVAGSVANVKPLGTVKGVTNPVAGDWSTFVAGAYSIITKGTTDTWTIDQNKSLFHNSDGTGG